MRIFIYSIFTIFSCNEKEEIDSNDFENEINCVEDESLDTEDTQSAVFSSKTEFTRIQELHYDQQETRGNPLKGFLTNYQWGSPANNFSHSLEFAYIPLSNVIQEEGVFTFETGLEPLLVAASERGNHLIPRVYIDYPSLDSGLPDYLTQSVECFPYTDYGGGCAPNYNSPELQTALLDFISEFGAQYDGDPRIGFVQLGLLGFWGEWHTYPYPTWFANDLFQQEFIAAFDDAFEQTHIQIRIPVQDTPQRTIGFHDDSFAYATIGDIEWFFWSKMVNAGADTRWEQVPTGGEIYPALQDKLFSNTYATGEYSQDFIMCIEQTHATYMINYQAFNLNGVGYIGNQKEEAEIAASSMGYEYTIETLTITLSELTEDTVTVHLKTALRNSGVAPFYYPLSLSLNTALGEKWIIQQNLENLLPSNNIQTYSLILEDLPIETLQEELFIQLDSDILLDNQMIQFANIEQLQGQISLESDFFCLHTEERYELGEDRGEGCFCDVDGLFRDLNDNICE